MIKRIDEMLKLWAQDLHSPMNPDFVGSGGGNMIAMLMECKGELIRGTRPCTPSTSQSCCRHQIRQSRGSSENADPAPRA